MTQGNFILPGSYNTNLTCDYTWKLN